MKLLLDENLSDRIVAQIVDLYPGTSHVKSQGFQQTSDTLIWDFARQSGYLIVSKTPTSINAVCCWDIHQSLSFASR